MKRKEPEKLLQETLVQRLAYDQRAPFLHPYYPRSVLEGQRAKRLGLQAGWADLVFPAPPTFHLELKAPGGKQSAIQRARQQELEAYGHVYVIADNFDDALDAIIEYVPWGYK